MLDTLREQLRSAHDDVRDLAQGVYPPVLTEHGLEAALQSAADRSTVAGDGLAGTPRAGTRPSVGSGGLLLLRRGAAERREARVRRRILLAGGADDSTLWISVTDDGGGFDPALATAGSGIIGMRDRLGSIGGRLEVSPSQGGSTVRCVVPIGTS